ncbi:uncharacterized protein LOC131936911 [Physella acuta]|uniref:uncharacterized protein LOC131936911 n=1 Tax=Physella acuta TaxID=109671 RepID=UPI0027DB1225|nr:uncharacterized protein LOC131936911 [Physella acuta]
MWPFIYLLVVFCLHSVAQVPFCTQTSPCTCVLHNGTVIDLSPLAKQGSPRWILRDPNFEFAYNPCYDFTYGGCANVSVCQYQAFSGVYYSLGTQRSASFLQDDLGVAYLHYYSRDMRGYIRYTYIQLTCSDEADDSFTYLGEYYPGQYSFHLTSRHCCPKKPNEIQ